MQENKDLEEKFKTIDKENYSLRQSTMGENSVYASLMGASVVDGEGVSNADKLKYEAKIKTLEQKLFKIQEGKLDDADHMLNLQKDNGKLTKDNQTLKDENKDLKERL